MEKLTVPIAETDLETIKRFLIEETNLSMEELAQRLFYDLAKAIEGSHNTWEAMLGDWLKSSGVLENPFTETDTANSN